MILKLNAPWRITFDTNPDLCNIKCTMCEEHSIYVKTKRAPNDRIMDFEIIKNVLENIHNKGLREIIPSTMGEPLLYPRFIDLIELVKKYKLKMNLTTNGTFPILGAEKWARLILPIASDVKISINGANKDINEEIMQGLNFDKLLENIKIWIKIRDEIREKKLNHPSITFQVTYMEKNFHDLPNILKLAIDLRVDRLKGHHLWITHAELQNESLRRNKDSIGRWNCLAGRLHKIVEESPAKDNFTIKLENVFKMENINKDQIVPDNFICPFLGKEAWIAWDGTFNVCCSPDNLRKSLGSFGNVKMKNFLELWNSPVYNNLVNNWGDFEVCNLCNMRKPIEDVIECGK